MTHDSAGSSSAMEADESGPDLEVVTEEVLPALIARLRSSRLGELEVRTGEWRIRLRRDPRAGTRVTAPTGSAAADAQPEAANGSVARSTAVGYFAPAPDLVVGASVQAGDLLGTIDVLGVSQEVIAPSDGVITSVLADDGQAVEYGQALAEIDALELIVSDGKDSA